MKILIVWYVMKVLKMIQFILTFLGHIMEKHELIEAG